MIDDVMIRSDCEACSECINKSQLLDSSKENDTGETNVTNSTLAEKLLFFGAFIVS